ncbi:hypothetical protein CesoFtcFv8_007413 [Champsocephalus esox]|uniref:Uncharacterized protein n=1 Tax=Champsocephalus esox TaxID=159716 RepID=A0AAN8H794_9TELE|nr:hypothetical protein CesoFtcFv8_007413 [Champsocephalus esox]
MQVALQSLPQTLLQDLFESRRKLQQTFTQPRRLLPCMPRRYADI